MSNADIAAIQTKAITAKLIRAAYAPVLSDLRTCINMLTAGDAEKALVEMMGMARDLEREISEADR